MFWFKICLIIFLLLFFFTNIFSSLKYNLLDRFYDVSARSGFILRTVIIEGQQNILQADIEDAIGVKKGAPLFAARISDIRSKLEDNPWVKTALVERRMPETLYIAIVERKPMAIWQFQQKLYLIDEEGNRISKDNIEKFNQLYHVVGVDANVYAKSLIDDLERHPGIANRLVSAVRYGGRRWNLNLEQDITVKMPENGFNVAYDYLSALNQKEKLFGQNYKMLDLRDPEKYYMEKKQ
jgi:cell division protein FtsQ